MKIKSHIKRFIFPFYNFLIKNCHVYDSVSSVKYLLEHDVSICRFGNGEMDLMQGDQEKFQKFDKVLANDLKYVAQHPIHNCVVAIPYAVYKKPSKNIYEEKTYKWWISYRKDSIRKWYKLFKRNPIIPDASFTRFYMDFKKNRGSFLENYISAIKKLWEDKNIVFVEGVESRLGVGNDLFSNAKSIKRILCPSTNAYFFKKVIMRKIIELVNPKDAVLIFALGPTATILSYYLTRDYGFKCYDLGHIDVEYEWFKLGATRKVALPYKYVNEAHCGNNPNPIECCDPYFSQIICRINNQNE